MLSQVSKYIRDIVVLKMASKDEVNGSQDVPRFDEEGLSADEIQLRAQGHVGELPRQFSAFSTLALAFSIVS